MEAYQIIATISAFFVFVLLVSLFKEKSNQQLTPTETPGDAHPIEFAPTPISAVPLNRNASAAAKPKPKFKRRRKPSDVELRRADRKWHRQQVDYNRGLLAD